MLLKMSQYRITQSIFCFSLIFILLISQNTFAQANGKITGKISDINGLVLSGANVYISQLNKGAVSNHEGNFNILNVSPGNYKLKVSYIGFQTQEINVNVDSNNTQYIEVQLNPGVIQGNEVLVLGERLDGQAKALNQQRTNDNITNVVSTDQISRFPDQNIGDAMKRIPGITVNYDQGEARFVNIRGTEPRLNSVMIDGDRVPSAEAEARNVQVDLIPSDMIQTIEVNKSITPDMDGDAIGGAVNLVTRSAPVGLRVSGTFGSGLNLLSEKPIWNGGLIIGNRFFDNKLGIILSGSVYDHHLGSDNIEGNWTEDKGNIYPDEWQVREYRIRRERTSVSGALDYQFSPNHNIYFKAIYNHRNDWENRYRLVYKVGKEQLERQTKGGIGNDANDNARLEDQKNYKFALSGEHILFNQLSMNWSVAYLKASEERPNERYIQFKIEDIPQTFDISNPEEPKIFFESTAPNELANWELDELTEEYQYTEEKDINVKLDFELPVSDGNYSNSLKFGGRFKNKDKERNNNFFEYTPINGLESLADVKLSNYSDPDFLAGDYLIGDFASNEFLGSLDLNNPALFEKEDKIKEYATQNFSASENIYAGYAMWTQNIDEKWKIIGGLRVENTDIEYTGYEFNEDTEEIKPMTNTDNYINFLPSIHINYYLNPNTIFRASWSNSIARPNYYDIVPYRLIIPDDEELYLGNPELKPTTSMNFDLMAEHYFQNIGIISGGFFYKSINDFIYIHNQKDYLDPKTNATYELFQPRNGAEATLLGFEFALQRRLDFLPSFLSNFNFYANYTYTYSSADNPVLNEQVEGDKDIELPGTAPHILNLALNYQDSRFFIGVSFNYSASYLDPSELDLTPGLERYYDKVTYLDASASYTITPQIRISAEANNLLNQPLRFYAGDSNRTYQAEYYSSRFLVSIKYNF